MTTLRDSPSGPPASLAQTTDDFLNSSIVVSGVTSTDALDSLETRLAFFTRLRVIEYFVGGTQKDIGVVTPVVGYGDTNWSLFGTNINSTGCIRPTGNAGRYGLYNLSVLPAQRAALILGSSAVVNAGFGFLPAQIESCEWTCSPNVASGSNGKYRFGFGSDAAGANFGNDGVYLEVDREISTFWRAVARKAGVATIVTTSVVGTNGVFFRAKVSRLASGAFEYYLNDVLVATIDSTNIPTGRIFVGTQIESVITSTQDLLIDTVDLRYVRT